MAYARLRLTALTGLLLYAGIVLVASQLASPYYSEDTWTLSELGSQSYERAWLMRLAFYDLSLSVALIVALVVREVEGAGRRAAVVLTLGVYAVMVLLSAVFSAKTHGAPAHNMESLLHTYLARAAGMSFALAIPAVAFGLRDRRFRYLSLVAFVLFAAGAVLFSTMPEARGFWQRGLVLVACTWMGCVVVWLGVIERKARKVVRDQGASG